MEQSNSHSLAGLKIALGLSGGIAAYKAPLLIRLFAKAGAEVRVLATDNALKFTTRWTLETLSGNPLQNSMFPEETVSSEKSSSGTHHIDTASWADLFVIAPATANLIGKIASGISDDVLTTTLCAFGGPVFLAPAMNSAMYGNPVTRKNLTYLRSIGYTIVDPGEGELACGDVGAGRLAEPEQIFEIVAAFQQEQQGATGTTGATSAKLPLDGQKIVVTAGPCREPLDPVRFISNRSSGKMGYALAEAARDCGARVTLISGPVSLRPPENIALISVETTAEMAEATLAQLSGASALIMAAAPADYRPTQVAGQKIKKSKSTTELKLTPTTDILLEVSKQISSKQNLAELALIGFALESENLLENAREKLVKKKLDMIVANSATESGCGPESETNRATLLSKNGEQIELPRLPKTELAREIFRRVIVLIQEKQKSHASQEE